MRRLTVTAPAELPALLLREAGSISDDEREAATLRAVLLRLHTAVGADFSGYKTATVRRRIAVRMAHHKVTTLQAYLELLEREPAELTDLAKGLLIGVTAFFRDPAAWAQLERQALPALLAAQDPGTELRAWVPACSNSVPGFRKKTQKWSSITSTAIWPRHTGPLMKVMMKNSASSSRKR